MRTAGETHCAIQRRYSCATATPSSPPRSGFCPWHRSHPCPRKPEAAQGVRHQNITISSRIRPARPWRVPRSPLPNSRRPRRLSGVARQSAERRQSAIVVPATRLRSLDELRRGLQSAEARRRKAGTHNHGNAISAPTVSMDSRLRGNDGELSKGISYHPNAGRRSDWLNHALAGRAAKRRRSSGPAPRSELRAPPRRIAPWSFPGELWDRTRY